MQQVEQKLNNSPTTDTHTERLYGTHEKNSNIIDA